MSALTKDRNTPVRENRHVAYPAKAGKTFFAGALACIDAAGYLTPGATAVGLKAAGRVEVFIDNSGGADGAVTVPVRRGCFKFANNGSVTLIHTLETAYIVDDQTVAADDGGGTRSAAGRIIEVESDGVWVEI